MYVEVVPYSTIDQIIYSRSNKISKEDASLFAELWLIVFSFVFSYHFHIADISSILIIALRFEYHFQSME